MNFDEEWQRQYVRLLVASDEALGVKFPLARLILLYSAIDIFAAADTADGKSNRHSFSLWVDRYVVPSRLNCTASDLWGARCGMLHTLRSDSDLSANKKARLIMYTWGSKSKRVADLNKAAARISAAKPSKPGFVAIDIGELHDAVRQGLARFLDELSNDSKRLDKVRRNASGFTDNFDEALLDQIA